MNKLKLVLSLALVAANFGGSCGGGEMNIRGGGIGQTMGHGNNG